MKKTPFLLGVMALIAGASLFWAPRSGPTALHASSVDPLTVPMEIVGTPFGGECAVCACCTTCDEVVVPSGQSGSGPYLYESHICEPECGDLCDPGEEDDADYSALAMEVLWDVARTGTVADVRRALEDYGEMASLNLRRGSIQVTRCNSLAGNFPLHSDLVQALSQ